ncbi:putative endoprotease [uncultured Mediterranean phage uvDeep-CGR2-AD7-C12]|nr:putative endoprotease [uncultured Mediterranean phage uvDeep-CGR2-AD7-C12]
MLMSGRDASIVAQVAAKVAGEVCAGSGNADLYLATVETVHNDLVERCALETVTAAFPGAAPAAAPAPAGPTQQSVAAAPVPRPAGGAPAGAQVGRKVYPRVDFCVGKGADEKQAAWNLLAFQPNEWSDGNGGTIKVFEVKEHADGSTDVAKSGKNFPNFSVMKEAFVHMGVNVSNNVGIWVNDGDSNVPLKVWDQAAGQTQADAVDFEWDTRRSALQQYTYANSQ